MWSCKFPGTTGIFPLPSSICMSVSVAGCRKGSRFIEKREKEEWASVLTEYHQCLCMLLLGYCCLLYIIFDGACTLSASVEMSELIFFSHISSLVEIRWRSSCRGLNTEYDRFLRSHSIVLTLSVFMWGCILSYTLFTYTTCRNVVGNSLLTSLTVTLVWLFRLSLIDIILKTQDKVL